MAVDRRLTGQTGRLRRHRRLLNQVLAVAPYVGRCRCWQLPAPVAVPINIFGDDVQHAHGVFTFWIWTGCAVWLMIGTVEVRSVKSLLWCVVLWMTLLLYLPPMLRLQLRAALSARIPGPAPYLVNCAHVKPLRQLQLFSAQTTNPVNLVSSFKRHRSYYSSRTRLCF